MDGWMYVCIARKVTVRVSAGMDVLQHGNVAYNTRDTNTGWELEAGGGQLRSMPLPYDNDDAWHNVSPALCHIPHPTLPAAEYQSHP